jgi:hypothetical protein
VGRKRKKKKKGIAVSRPDETAPSMEDMNKLIKEHVVKKTPDDIEFQNGNSALTL